MNTQIDANFLQSGLKPRHPIYRIDEGDRKYYTIKDDGGIDICDSVTSVFSKVMPISEYLIKWYADFGYQKALQMMKEKAHYGTFSHICFSQLLKNKTFDLSQLQDMIDAFVKENNIDFYTGDWENKIKDDLLALQKFIIDYEVEPIAIEIPLIAHLNINNITDFGIGGTIDLIAKMKIGNGVNGNVLKADLKYNKDGVLMEDKRQTITAIIDWKSGRHGFYASHEAQLHLYKMIWEANFNDIAIDKVYNWSPKDWGDEPSYYLKDQTNSQEKYKIPHYLAIFQLGEEGKKSQQHHEINGVIDLTDKSNANLDVKIEDLQTMLERKHREAKSEIPIIPDGDDDELFFKLNQQD